MLLADTLQAIAIMTLCASAMAMAKHNRKARLAYESPILTDKEYIAVKRKSESVSITATMLIMMASFVLVFAQVYRI